MKRKFKILTFLLSAVIMFSACEEDERTYKDIDPNSDLPTTIMVSVSDFIWALPGDQTGEIEKQIYVKCHGKPVSSDVTIPFTVDSTTLDPSMYTLSSNNFVIPAGSLSASVTITFDLDAMPLDVYYDFYYSLGTPSMYELKDADYSIGQFTAYKACPLNLDDFVGTFETNQDGDIWETTVKRDPDNDRGIILYQVFWLLEDDSLKLTIDTDGIISAEDQFTNQDDHYGGLGRIEFQDISGEVTNTCVPIFEYTTTPYLPDSGYWWGGEFTFVLTKISDKTSVNRDNNSNGNTDKVPFRY